MPVPEDYKRTDTAGESKNLRAADFPLDQKWRLVIEDVNLETMPARDGKGERKRLVVSFEGREKTLVLNITNQEFLEQRLTDDPNRWIGAKVVLWRTTTKFEGKVTPAFRFLEAKPAPTGTRPKPKPRPEPEEETLEAELVGDGSDADDSVPF